MSRSRAFTLAELLISITLIGLLAVPSISLSEKFISAYADPYSDFHVKREAEATRRWIQNIINRSLISRRDCVLQVPNAGLARHLRAMWKEGTDEETWQLERTALRERGGSGPRHTYSSRFQTMSPGFTLEVYRLDESGAARATTLTITVSVYGLVSLRDR